MSERILILDDVTSSRIALRVRLASAAYETVQAGSIANVARTADGGDIDLAIVSGAFAAPAQVAEVCAQLNHVSQPPPVLVLGSASEADVESRLRTLASGAADYLPATIGKAGLLAHIRSLLRQRRPFPERDWYSAPAAGTISAPPRRASPGGEWPDPLAQTAVIPGLAEAPASLPPSEWLALVTERPGDLAPLRAALGRLIAERLEPLRRDELLPAIRRGRLPVAILLGLSHDETADLRLLAELRARAATERIPVLVLGAEGPDLAILALDLGAQDVLPVGYSVEELALRLRQRLQQSQARTLRQRKLAEDLRMANLDPLTGLSNRRATFRDLDLLHATVNQWPQGALTEAGKDSGSIRPVDPGYALLVLDIDRFKQVNDSFGHAGGDQVLAGVAARLDATGVPGAITGRIGGEEFLVALPGLGAKDARAAAETLRRRIEAEPFVLESGAEVWVTVSIGLCFPGPGEPVDSAFDRADRALYEAKARGRNAVAIGRPAA